MQRQREQKRARAKAKRANEDTYKGKESTRTHTRVLGTVGRGGARGRHAHATDVYVLTTGMTDVYAPMLAIHKPKGITQVESIC